MDKKYNNMSGIRTFIPKDSKKRKRESFAPWYLRIYELVDILNTNTEKGLTNQEAQKRRKKSGYNLLYPEFKRTFRSALIDHVKAVSSVLLACSLLLYYAFSGVKDYLIASGIIIFSILFECALEHFSTIKLSKARKNSSLKAYVKRNGTFYSMDSRYLVPGDIVYLPKGSIVPADVRLFDSNSFKVYETPINGSEFPVDKIAKELSDDSKDDNSSYVNMALAGSIVTQGNAWGIVCFTGQDTRFTNVPKNKHDNVPSTFKYVYSVSSMLSIFSSFVGAVMLVLGLFFSSSLSITFLFALTIATCSLSDGIVSYSALSFASGMSEMKKNGAVLRNLSAVEDISFVDTLMAKQNTIFPVQRTELETAYVGIDSVDGEEEKKLVRYFLLLSEVKKNLSKKSNKNLSFDGKQNAIAAAVYGEKLGIKISSQDDNFLITESQHIENDDFSSLLAYENGQKYLFLKGDARDILPLCKYHVTLRGTKTLSQNDIDNYEYFISSNTNETGYLIALAKCETAIDKLSEYDNRRMLTLCGFIKFKTYFGINYFKEVSDLKKSGIDVCMFSSDSYMKAYNLGKNSGIFQNNSQIITEEELHFISVEEFDNKLPFYKLFLNFSSSLFNSLVVKKKNKGHVVAVATESTDDLIIMKNSNVSFVVEGESSEMIKQSSDVILSSGGFDKINKVISISKKIYRRIHSICEYFVYNYLFCLFLYIFGTIFGIDYRVYDFLIFSGLISGIISVFLATVSINSKNGEARPFKRKKNISPMTLKHSVILAAICSFGCSVVSCGFNNNSQYTICLITFSLLSLFSSIVILNDGKPIYESHIGINLRLIITLVVITFVILLFILTPLSDILSYGNVSFVDLGISVGVSVVIPAIYPIVISFLEKTKKR